MSSMFSKYVGELDADGLTMSDQPFTVRPLVLKKHRTGRITNYRVRSKMQVNFRSVVIQAIEIMASLIPELLQHVCFQGKNKKGVYQEFNQLNQLFIYEVYEVFDQFNCKERIAEDFSRERSFRCAAPPSAQSCCCMQEQLRHLARPGGMRSLSRIAQTTLLTS